ncbi:MAG: hypothetical protein WAK17_08715 [Candidatus Nitrosopolaris sp.]
MQKKSRSNMGMVQKFDPKQARKGWFWVEITQSIVLGYISKHRNMLVVAFIDIVDSVFCRDAVNVLGLGDSSHLSSYSSFGTQ